MQVCQIPPPSFLNRPHSMVLGSSMQSLRIGDSFAPSGLTSSPVVTSSVGLALHGFGDQVTLEVQCSFLWL